MKPYLCNECKFNNNGWCNKYECNGKRRIEFCDKYNEEVPKEEIEDRYDRLNKEMEQYYDKEEVVYFLEWLLENYNITRKVK